MNMQAVVATGAWGWLSGISRLGAHKLACLSEMIDSVRVALASRAATVTLATVDVRLDHLSDAAEALPFTLMLDSAPSGKLAHLQQVDRIAVSDFVRAHTRRVTLRPPNLGAVLESALRVRFPASWHRCLAMEIERRIFFRSACARFSEPSDVRRAASDCLLILRC